MLGVYIEARVDATIIAGAEVAKIFESDKIVKSSLDSIAGKLQAQKAQQEFVQQMEQASE